MADLMKRQAFHALEYEGTTYDCGDKIGLLRANVAFALRRPDLADARAQGDPAALLLTPRLGVRQADAGSIGEPASVR